MRSPHSARARAFVAPRPSNSDPVDGIASNTKRRGSCIVRTRFAAFRKTEKCGGAQ
jgi:hypothetical protein